MKYQFTLFEYSKKWWWFYLISIALAIPWFILTGLISISLNSETDNPLFFIVIFLTGVTIINSFIARWRYKNIGHLISTSTGLTFRTKEGTEYMEFPITDEVRVTFRAGESNWLNLLNRLGGFFRYSGPRYHDNSETNLDRLEIGSKNWYIKIRSKEEATLFQEFLNSLDSKDRAQTLTLN